MANAKPTAQLKAEILSRARELGPDIVAKETGYSAKTITKWLANAELDNLTRIRVDMSPDEFIDNMCALLRAIALDAAMRELELASKSEVGFVNKVRTTAIHDLNLLEGKATEIMSDVDESKIKELLKAMQEEDKD